MSEDALIVPILPDQTGADALTTAIQGIERALTQMAAAQDRVSASAATQREAAASLTDTLKSWGEKVTYIGALYDEVVGKVEGIAALSAEQERLNESSARLALDYDAGAAAAGRFADETDAMAAANRFAASNIHLSQTELEALFRVAGAKSVELGVTVGDASRQLTEALIHSRENGLVRFGAGLSAVAGESHTVEDRLHALVVEAGHTTQATDDSRDALERWKDSIDDAKRAGANAFVTELSRISALGGEFSTATENAEKLARAARLVGVEMARIGSRSYEGVRTIGSAFNVVANYFLEVTGQVRDRSGTDEAVRGFTRHLNRLEGMSDEAPLDLSDQPDIDGSGEMTFSAEETGAAEAARQRLGRDARGRRSESAQQASARAAQQRRRAFEQLMSRAFQGSGMNGLGSTERQSLLDAATRPAGEDEGDGLAKAGAERSASEAAFASSTQGQRLAETRERDAQRRQQLRDRELAQLRTFTERYEDLHNRQAVASELAANAATTAFSKLGEGLAKHAELVAQGRETIGDGLRGVLSDTLSSIGHEAIAKGAMEEAEGLAALATPFTAPLAPGHFAAGAAFLAAGALTTALGGASAVSPSSRSSGGSTGASRGSGGERLSGGRPSLGSGDGGSITYQQIFNAPVFGGRRASNADVGEQIHVYDVARQERLQRGP